MSVTVTTLAGTCLPTWTGTVEEVHGYGRYMVRDDNSNKRKMAFRNEMTITEEN